MSALARYFLSSGKAVAGYDRTPTELTRLLEQEGALIHFEDNVALIPPPFHHEGTLVIRTPAVPSSHSELTFFAAKSFPVMKRSQVLGWLSNDYITFAVAGTHGKTTISTLLTHILSRTPAGCMAFLGGISKNHESNFIHTPGATTMVAEADEYDRSFLHLNPNMAVISAVDDDHMDIYGTYENLLQSFRDFINQIKTGGILLVKKGLNIAEYHKPGIRVFNYHLHEKADFYATNISSGEGYNDFDLVTPTGTIQKLRLGLPGIVNIENAVAACGIALLAGWHHEIIRDALRDFSGVVRRFDVRVKTPDRVYMDDYAHHPEEIRACITSVRHMFPKRKITGIFQPHLFSRTRDLADGFAHSLELLDRLILLDIYPAREEPIPGVTSELIFHKVRLNDKRMCSKDEVIHTVKNLDIEILLTLGAGDIDTLVDPLTELLKGFTAKEKKA